MTFADAVAGYRHRVEAALDHWLPPADKPPARLHEAMRYATLSGGKRMRALLIYATAEALDRPPETVDTAAIAVELVHAYSLVHDDLPAMDDDDLRRGRPSCHRAYDEATAILVGDALQTLAFDVLARAEQPAGADHRLRLTQLLAGAAGSLGMAGGQAMDLAATGARLDAAELEAMHIHKTGALIRAAVLMACHAGPPPEHDVLRGLDHYAKCLGLAFQIQDDILDELGDPDAMGKARGADAARGKATFPSALGLEASRQRARELYEEARDSLAVIGERTDGLHWLARQVVDRRA